CSTNRGSVRRLRPDDRRHQGNRNAHESSEWPFHDPLLAIGQTVRPARALAGKIWTEYIACFSSDKGDSTICCDKGYGLHVVRHPARLQSAVSRNAHPAG